MATKQERHAARSAAAAERKAEREAAKAALREKRQQEVAAANAAARAITEETRAKAIAKRTEVCERLLKLTKHVPKEAGAWGQHRTRLFLDMIDEAHRLQRDNRANVAPREEKTNALNAVANALENANIIKLDAFERALVLAREN